VPLLAGVLTLTAVIAPALAAATNSTDGKASYGPYTYVVELADPPGDYDVYTVLTVTP
jgi:hypothetical protein